MNKIYSFSDAPSARGSYVISVSLRDVTKQAI